MRCYGPGCCTMFELFCCFLVDFALAKAAFRMLASLIQVRLEELDGICLIAFGANALNEAEGVRVGLQDVDLSAPV